MNPRFYIKRRCEYRGKQGSYLCYAYHWRLLCLWTMAMDYGYPLYGYLLPVNSIYLPGMITFSHLAVKKWILAWATCEQWRQLSTPFPRHIVCQFQSLYTPSPRGLIATPYSTSVSVPLYAITARSITNQLASSGVGIGFTFLPHVIIPDK
jgi:hypothetical protein